MKRETALRYAREIHRKVHQIDGLLPTPLYSHEAMQFKKIWVFGSTAKGSPDPNDLDLLIHIEPVGTRRNWRETQLDVALYKRTGAKFPPSSTHYAMKWLSKGMKKVSRHLTDIEEVEIDVKVEIYPKFCLPEGL